MLSEDTHGEGDLNLAYPQPIYSASHLLSPFSSRHFARARVKTFFAPEANIQLSVGGAYELLFDLDAPIGSQGGEGMKVLSYFPMEMLSYEWNAPPQFPEARRGPHTWVVVQFSAHGQKQVQVRLTHPGWRDGEEWEKVFQYFQSAWDIVLARLEYRYSGGTIDWNNPYRPPQGKTYEVAR